MIIFSSLFLSFSFYSEREGSKNFRNTKKNGKIFLCFMAFVYVFGLIIIKDLHNSCILT